MTRLRLDISMSLDGFVAGPNQSEQNPLGEGGMQLHEWVFPLAAWRETHGEEGGAVNASSAVVEESRENLGATVMDGKDVALSGGANVAQQYLSAGRVDQIQLHVVPVLLGGGARLFDDLAGADIGLECTRAIHAPGVTHLAYRVVK